MWCSADYAPFELMRNGNGEIPLYLCARPLNYKDAYNTRMSITIGSKNVTSLFERKDARVRVWAFGDYGHDAILARIDGVHTRRGLCIQGSRIELYIAKMLGMGGGQMLMRDAETGRLWQEINKYKRLSGLYPELK